MNIFNKIFRFFVPKGGYKKAFNDGIIVGKQTGSSAANKALEAYNKKNKMKEP